MHLLAVTALHWGATSMPAEPVEIVDLTVMDLPGAGATPKEVTPLTPTPRPPSPTPQTSSTDEPTKPAVATPSALEADSSPTSTAGSEFSGGTASYGEITRFPKVKKEIKAQYPEEAKKAGVDGPVVLEIIIDKAGQVRDVKLVSGPGHGLNESAIEALRKFEFQPAFKGEESVAVKIRYTYRFKLEVN
ncbi:MAG: energy transducer TonB [Bdellovibrio sp. ArHS]|nr:MAG: energy transducer TonB [Bdellovibrio sp. ArHS]